MNRNIKAIILAIGLSATAASAFAATPFDAAHPRMAQVNHRLAHQAHRIDVARKEGLISKRKAMLLRAEDRRIGRHERIDALRHGGRITKTEQRKLNHQETVVGRKIG